MPIKLRPYQQEDVAAVVAAHQMHRCVLGRAPTGSGKAVLLAAVGDHYADRGRVLVLVDTSSLVEQLAGTFGWATTRRVGIEMADQTVAGAWFAPPEIVVGSVQTQYSGPEGQERYRRFDPRDFSCLLLDETETFLAPKARQVVDYYLAGNPALKVFGTSATPFRTDGTPMANLFDAVAFDRDILWGIEEGWLVKPRQGFVRVSVDFSSLKVRKREDGDADYSDADIAERLNNEATLVEIAKGILGVIGTRKTIVACPDVATAKGVTHYLDAERSGCAQCVYGEMSDEAKARVMQGHKRGDYQILVSVMMLTKGYDDPSAVCFVNCRKTRSKRLYQQMLGRVTRLAPEIAHTIGDVATADERRARIAASTKPEAVMFNLVGIDEDVRDITVIDILGEKQTEEAVQRAKKKALKEDGEQDAEESARAAAEEIAEEEREREEKERKQRSLVQVNASVEVEYDDGRRSASGPSVGDHLPPRQVSILRKAGVSEKQIARMSREESSELSSEIVRRWKLGLCSYRQAEALHRSGYSRDEIRDMTRAQASAAIDQLKANGWKRGPVQRQQNLYVVGSYE